MVGGGSGVCLGEVDGNGDGIGGGSGLSDGGCGDAVVCVVVLLEATVDDRLQHVYQCECIINVFNHSYRYCVFSHQTRVYFQGDVNGRSWWLYAHHVYE